MDSARGERTPHEVVACEKTGRVLRVHEREVQEDALDDEEDADGGHHDADTRYDPVDAWVGRPSEDEEARGYEPSDNEGGEEAALRSTQPAAADLGLYHEPDVSPVGGNGDHDADGDGEEGKTHLAEVEVVHALVDEREGFKEAVEDTVDESCVDGGKGNAGVEKH